MRNKEANTNARVLCASKSKERWKNGESNKNKICESKCWMMDRCRSRSRAKHANFVISYKFNMQPARWKTFAVRIHNLSLTRTNIKLSCRFWMCVCVCDDHTSISFHLLIFISVRFFYVTVKIKFCVIASPTPISHALRFNMYPHILFYTQFNFIRSIYCYYRLAMRNCLIFLLFYYVFFFFYPSPIHRRNSGFSDRKSLTDFTSAGLERNDANYTRLAVNACIRSIVWRIRAEDRYG